MLTKEVAYAYAQGVDRVLDKVLKNHPVSNPENHDAYAELIMTIRSELTMLEIKNNKHSTKCPTCGARR